MDYCPSVIINGPWLTGAKQIRGLRSHQGNAEANIMFCWNKIILVAYKKILTALNEKIQLSL